MFSYTGILFRNHVLESNLLVNVIPKNHISLCLQLVFQSNYKTLQNKEIETIISELQLILQKEFNALIRE